LRRAFNVSEEFWLRQAAHVRADELQVRVLEDLRKVRGPVEVTLQVLPVGFDALEADFADLTEDIEERRFVFVDAFAKRPRLTTKPHRLGCDGSGTRHPCYRH